MADRYHVPRIGVAETAERNGRVALYAVHEERGTRLYVSYIGYREGGVTTGLALGGPGWTPPHYFDTDRSGFKYVHIFNEGPV